MEENSNPNSATNNASRNQPPVPPVMPTHPEQPIQSTQPTQSTQSVQQPTQPVQPIVPAPDITLPTYKPPHDPKMVRVIAGGIIAIVIIIGMSIFLTALNKQTGNSEDNSSSQSNKKEEAYLTENDKQTLVKTVLTEVKEAAIDIDETKNATTDNKETVADDVVKTSYAVQDIYDSDNPLYFASGAKVPTSTNKSFGFVITASDQPELIKQMSENAKAKLKKLGFAIYKDAGEDASGSYGWFDSNNKIICTPLRDSLATLSLSCGHTSWIPSEKVALVNSLATAYMKKEDKFPLYIDVSPDKIENSPYEPYQKLLATLPDSVGLFYRASSDAEWVFFLGTQATVPCSKYYADSGAKHAFQGDTCLGTNGELSKVKETVAEKDKTPIDEEDTGEFEEDEMLIDEENYEE